MLELVVRHGRDALIGRREYRLVTCPIERDPPVDLMLYGDGGESAHAALPPELGPRHPVSGRVRRSAACSSYSAGRSVSVKGCPFPK
jgi:hypothetical protein